MSVPWKELGLSRFLAVDHSDTLLFEDGKPCPGVTVDSDEGLLRVSYALEKAGENVVDVHLLSRTLLPTLSEHSPTGLCDYFGIALEAGKEKEELGELFAALIAEGLTLKRDLLSLLGQLLPGATGQLLSSLVPWSREHVPSSVETSRELEPPQVVSFEEILSRNGAIGQGLAAFEDRPGQQEMALLVSRTFEKGGTSVIEAGSGTGKTFAYLIPALLHLRSHGSVRLVVSTRTKQLQEQLYAKDLPFLLTRIHPQLKVALLKGRENYLCLRRWQRVLSELIEGLERDLLASLAPLASWLFRTETGDVEENYAFLADPNGSVLWSRLRDEPKHCVGSACPYLGDCFSMTARRRAKAASLVVVNHSLLLADLLTEHGILGDYQILAVDEAHALEQAARQAMTSTLIQGTLDRLLSAIHTPTRHRAGGWLVRLPFPRSDRRVERVRALCQTLHGMNVRLFTVLADVLPTEERRDRLPLLEDLRPQIERILQTLDQLKTEIESIGEALDNPEVQRETDGLITEASAIATLLGMLFSPAAESIVHWYERKNGDIALHVSPLEVASFLKEALYPQLQGLILTSATVSLAGEFAYLRDSLGLDAAPKERSYSVTQAPFSHDERMRVYLAEFLPPVEGPVEAYATEIALLAAKVVETMHKNVLVLFTSYLLLRAVHERLTKDTPIFAQGIDGPISKLIERFRNSEGGAILLGTDSFWEGVDLPGEELEVLIITRLPFPVPTDPILSALAERLANAGRDPFRELFVPRAILKLRQGIGRLIRTRNDRGAVILTDRRILRKSYGSLFTVSLPVPGQRIASLSDLLVDLKSWFEGH